MILPPFGLCDYPSSLAKIATEYLECEGVAFYSPEPLGTPEPLPKLLLIDGCDYIIAGDFEVKFEEVVHRPEYFEPK